MFVGRVDQIDQMERCLLQTRAGRPKSFMLVGERGIGKTSLLAYFAGLAKGWSKLDDGSLGNFLVLETDLEPTSTELGFMRRIERCLARELAKTEKARGFLAETWGFLKRVEQVGGVKVRASDDIGEETYRDEFAYSLASTIQRLVSPDDSDVFNARYDGVILLIDEADRGARQVGLGGVLKLLLERLERHGCRHLMVGLAGLPELPGILSASHISVLRALEHLPLGPLSDAERGRVIVRALEEAEGLNGGLVTKIEPDAEMLLRSLSEGFPHFLQQFGASAFDLDDDNTISSDDVLRGATGPNGAIRLIGDRYYRDDFYSKINKDTYRQVLRIMSKRGDAWVKKSEIREKWEGADKTLNNAIQALRERRIILSKEGEIGVYRLQSRAFALWISMEDKDRKGLAG